MKDLEMQGKARGKICIIKNEHPIGSLLAQLKCQQHVFWLLVSKSCNYANIQ